MKKLSQVKMLSRVEELASLGLIHLVSGEKVDVKMPPKFPGKSLSEYLKEIKEGLIP